MLEGCVLIYQGCTDSVSTRYVAAANSEDGSCVYDVYGCTDPIALNFDSLATVSVGCVTRVAGCTVRMHARARARVHAQSAMCAPCVCVDCRCLAGWRLGSLHACEQYAYINLSTPREHTPAHTGHSQIQNRSDLHRCYMCMHMCMCM